MIHGVIGERLAVFSTMASGVLGKRRSITNFVDI